MTTLNARTQTFLVELLTEELPPKSLKGIGNAFLQNIIVSLTKADISFGHAVFFATPRRLAVMIQNVLEKQPDTTIERKGPALKSAFDADGKPTTACIGFMKSLNISQKQLITLKAPHGEWVGFNQHVLGKKTVTLLPDIVREAMHALPIPKRMRWGNQSDAFIRPVHSILMLLGNKIIPATYFGIKSGRKTLGHRFLSHKPISIQHPDEYVSALKNAYVLVDFDERKQKIQDEIQNCVKKQLSPSSKPVVPETLLDEVTGLVEWPVALCGSFDESFLNVPQEVLMSSMQDHQRYFPIVNEKGRCLPYFIFIAALSSQNPSQVIAGNERVLRARLSDAAFFYEIDQKHSLEKRVDLLKQIVFQDRLGTLYDKANRLSLLSLKIAEKLHASTDKAKKAGWLAKTDLTTQLVSEFPNLQGIAGYHYALADHEDLSIAHAIKDHYLPRFSGDQLPDNILGCILAISDRMDTLVGIIGINQHPTGEKDPFALRRAALGIIRILIEKSFNIDLKEIVLYSQSLYSNRLINLNASNDVLSFIIDRLKPWYHDQGITSDVLDSVIALNITNLDDLHRRVLAVSLFKKLPDAEALSIANKRVSHILSKYTDPLSTKHVDTHLFEHGAENTLWEKVTSTQKQFSTLSENYENKLILLAQLREPIDAFFDHVLVMTDDISRRENRILLLKTLRELFLEIADIAYLQ